ncbi:MAG TPA: response regulator [Longimicrobiales bacterium]|nr:response regulator [Longimicrobiales bacterium]
MSPKVRLLLVEDSEDDAELIRRELERSGLELTWKRVDNEPEFLSALHEEWDVIVSDFQMPTFNGLRAFSVYREAGLDTPFIFVSGALGEERAVEAMRAGARDYVLKDNLARLNVAVRRELAASRIRAAQRAAEEAALREQRRLSVAVEASGAGVFEHMVPPDANTYYNERWAAILGVSPDEVPDDETLVPWLLEHVHPEDRERIREAYARFIDGRTERLQVEVRARREDGHAIDVSISANAVERTAAGRATHVVGVMLDLTERRKLEAQFRQAQKMEAIGRLAGGVAHDFNNLLTVIISSGELVLQTLEPEHGARADVQEMLNAAGRAAALTEQLLTFSRSKPVSPRVVDANQVVSDIEGLLRRMLGEDVEVVMQLAPDARRVRIDPGSLEQVIVNLAVNARDAMPGGGRLTIESRNVELGADSAIGEGDDVPAGSYTVLSVADEGVGLDEATRRRIFEPFFTTKEPGKGTGLGLSTCYGIVTQAGGRIELESELGVGTTFHVYLPSVADDADEDAPPEPHAAEALGGSETVLVAEDDDIVRRVVVRVLGGLGYRVIEADNGARALEHLRGPDRVDLLLTDLVMGGMGGLELVRAAAELRPDLRVLYMSGYVPHSGTDQGALEPGAHILGKPFTPVTLARKVREVLDAGEDAGPRS